MSTQIKICKSMSGTAFPYGHLSKENAEFVGDAVGLVFPATREGMNYYRLPNNMLVHVYNAFEIPIEKQVADVDTLAAMFAKECEALSNFHRTEIECLSAKIEQSKLDYTAKADNILKRISEMSLQDAAYAKLKEKIRKILDDND